MPNPTRPTAWPGGNRVIPIPVRRDAQPLWPIRRFVTYLSDSMTFGTSGCPAGVWIAANVPLGDCRRDCLVLDLDGSGIGRANLRGLRRLMGESAEVRIGRT